MIFSFLSITPVKFYYFIIDWHNIDLINIIRAFIFIIGCAFLPGACLWNLLFPNNTLHKKFKVDLFIIKITFYPLFSFIILGIAVLIFDQIGLVRNSILNLLFLLILTLFFIDLIIQLRRKQKTGYLIKEINLSKQSLPFLLIIVGVILFSLSIAISTKYLILGDSWVGIAHANFIGVWWQNLGHSWVYSSNYPVFWAYITYGLSVLSGIPFVNLNVLLTPFLYLFFTTTYLLIKSILYRYKDIYSFIATFFTITFTGLIYSFSFEKRGSISNLIFDGLINFRYKSISLFLLFSAVALFLLSINKDANSRISNKKTYENYFTLVIAALFLISSYMIYFFTLFIGFIILFVYCLIIKTTNKSTSLKSLSHFILFTILFWLLFDLLLNFYLSFIFLNRIITFIPLNFIGGIMEIIPYPIIMYLILLLFYSFVFILQHLFVTFKGRKLIINKIRLKSKFKVSTMIFIFFLCVFIIFLVLHIDIMMGNILFPKSKNNFLNYYMSTYLISCIGTIGILGLFLSYYSYKYDRNLFIFLSFWIFIIFILASFKIFVAFLKDFPLIPTFYRISTKTTLDMNYWFSRLWFYAIPAISILSTIGLMELRKKLKSIKFLIKRNYLNKFIKNILISLFIFFSLTSLILNGMVWQEKYKINDDEAQITGWVSRNFPAGSNVLVYKELGNHLSRSQYLHIYDPLDSAIEASKEYFGDSKEWWFITYANDPYCSLKLLENFGGFENVLEFEDQNKNGEVNVNFNFNSPQKNGTIEYLIYSTNNSNRFWTSISDRSIDGLDLWNGNFSYYDGNSYVPLQSYEENVWYHILIDFECTKGRYKGLDQYEWRVVINNTEYRNLKMLQNSSQMDSISFGSAFSDFKWQVYLDILNFSWDPNFQIGKYLFNITFMTDYLLEHNIKWYIHTSDLNWRLRLMENKYISTQDLINNYFQVLHYKYGSLSIYSANISS
ncbi:MAG: hypothetical protein ACFFB0_14655 [Promethearchaeota archaeon]